MYNHNTAGTPRSIAKDQEVPIVTTSSSSSAVVAGKSTYEFQSLEMEAESELQEIQTMLSMFDDIPATMSSDKDKPQNTQCHHTTTEVQGQRQGSDGEKLLKPSIVAADQVSSGNRSNGGRVTAADNDMDIESILQEMNTIDGKGEAQPKIHSVTYMYSKVRAIIILGNILIL